MSAEQSLLESFQPKHIDYAKSKLGCQNPRCIRAILDADRFWQDQNFFRSQIVELKQVIQQKEDEIKRLKQRINQPEQNAVLDNQHLDELRDLARRFQNVWRREEKTKEQKIIDQEDIIKQMQIQLGVYEKEIARLSGVEELNRKLSIENDQLKGQLARQQNRTLSPTTESEPASKKRKLVQLNGPAQPTADQNSGAIGTAVSTQTDHCACALAATKYAEETTALAMILAHMGTEANPTGDGTKETEEKKDEDGDEDSGYIENEQNRPTAKPAVKTVEDEEGEEEAEQDDDEATQEGKEVVTIRAEAVSKKCPAELNDWIVSNFRQHFTPFVDTVRRGHLKPETILANFTLYDVLWYQLAEEEKPAMQEVLMGVAEECIAEAEAGEEENDGMEME